VSEVGAAEDASTALGPRDPGPGVVATTDPVEFDRFAKGLRTATLAVDGTIRLGIPRWVAELHRGAFPTDESHVEAPGTFEYLVAAAAGCLLDHYGNAVELLGLQATDGTLTSSAYGEVTEESDRCLMVSAIRIAYRLELPPARELTDRDVSRLERALDTHTRRCPIARTLRGRTAVVASLTVTRDGAELLSLGPCTSNLQAPGA